MNVGLKVDGTMVLVGAVGVALLAAYWWREDLKTAFNPADPDNLANRTVNNLVQSATGTEDTLGTLAYEYRWLTPLTWPSIAKEYAEYGETDETRRLAAWWEEIWK